MKNSITHDFVDEKGNPSEIIITGNNDKIVNLKPNYKLQRPDTKNKFMRKNAKGKSILTSDIGVKSEGFAPIFTLAFIIVISLLTIFYFIWKF